MSWILKFAQGETATGPLQNPPAARSTTPSGGADRPASPLIGSEDQMVPPSPMGNFPLSDPYPKVPDPVFKGRMVSTRQSNRPFLSYREYREKREAEHNAWAVRMKEREEKIARGEDVGPAEPDPTEEQEIGCLGFSKFLLTVLIVFCLAGKFFTDSYTWNYQVNLAQFWPSNQTLYTEKSLANFDGTVRPDAPILLGIDGDVYDVSANRRVYGPGGSYHVFAGKDAARAFVTGCFTHHLTHDIRGLTEKQLKSLDHWKNFFKNHKDYPKVGRVAHDPIDPNSPIPGPCPPPPPPPEHPVHPTPNDATPAPQPAPTPVVVEGVPETAKHQEL